MAAPVPAPARTLIPVMALGLLPEAAAVLERELRPLGYQLFIATSQADALKRVLVERPFVLILDITTPSVDAVSLARHVSSTDLETALVVIGPRGSLEDLLSLFRAGISDYVVRPCAIAAIVEAVSRGNALHQRRRASREAFGQKMLKEKSAPQFATQEQVAALFRDSVESFRSGQVPLPPPPRALSELRRLITNPDAKLDDVVRLIDDDLTATILRLSNSSVYGGSGKVEDLSVAVRRVGFRQTQAWVETAFALRRFQAKDPKLAALQTRMWRYAIARGVTMRALAEHPATNNLVMPEMAYITGFFADVGAVYALQLLNDRHAAIGTLPPIDPSSTLPLVREFHGMLSGLVLQSDVLPERIVYLSRVHHTDDVPAQIPADLAIMILASSIADKFVSEGDQDCTRILGHDPNLVMKIRAMFGLMPAVLQKVIDHARDEFDSLTAVITAPTQ